MALTLNPLTGKFDVTNSSPTSIVGISGTKAQFDTAVTDGNFLYVGDVTQYTDELAQDAVGGILDNGTVGEIVFSYDDATPKISATIENAAVTLAKMANLAQDQFIGRTTASTGVPETATITAAARTVLDDSNVESMVNTLGGASSTGSGGLVRLDSPTFTTQLVSARIGIGKSPAYSYALDILGTNYDVAKFKGTGDWTNVIIESPEGQQFQYNVNDVTRAGNIYGSTVPLSGSAIFDHGPSVGGAGALCFVASNGQPTVFLSSADNIAGNVTERLRIQAGGVGVKLAAAPTAWLHLGAGTTAASTAPLKFTSGSLLTTAEAGAVEFLTDRYYATITTGAARKTLAFTTDITGTNSGTNTGDQTSIVGISGTLAQFNTACTDADFAPIASPSFTTQITTPKIVGASSAKVDIFSNTYDVVRFKGTGDWSNVIFESPEGQQFQFNVNDTTRAGNIYGSSVPLSGAAIFDHGPSSSSPGAMAFVTANNNPIVFLNSTGAVTATESARFTGAGTFGIGVTTVTAVLHLKAGTATASTAPVKLTSGTLNTSAEAGALEFLTDRLTFTGTTGTTRKDIADFSYRAITALRTLDGSDELVNCTSGTFAVTLPTAVGFTKQYIVKNSGTGVITINTTSSQTIDGKASGTLTLNQYQSLTFRSDGANWILV